MPATTDLTAALILGDATSPDMGGPQALGHDLGATLTEAEVRWLMTHEYARHAADVVWRRSKLGLRMTADEVEELEGGCGGSFNSISCCYCRRQHHRTVRAFIDHFDERTKL